MSCIQFLSTVKYFKVITLQIKKKSIYLSYQTQTDQNANRCVSYVIFLTQIKLKFK